MTSPASHVPVEPAPPGPPRPRPPSRTRRRYEAIAAAEPASRRRSPASSDQRRQLKLIASENYASPAVLLAMGNWLSDKYAEGTIGTVSTRAARSSTGSSGRRRARAALFGAARLRAAALRHRRQPGRVLGDPGAPGRGARPAAAGVQSRQRSDRGGLGAPAPGASPQRMLGMSLDAGGHLTHGFRPTSPASCSSRPATGPTRRPGWSTTTRSPPRPGSSAADPRGRLLGVPANTELPRHARDRRRGRRHTGGGHGALCRPGRGRRADRRPEPGADADVVTTTTHKSLPGPAAGSCCAPGSSPVRRPGLPHRARRTAAARDGRQSGRARRGPRAVVRRR